MKKEEEWKDVPDYEGLYQASSFGRIRSVDRYISYPTLTKRFPSKILASFLSWGYPMVALCNGKSKQKKTVHKLVASAFLGKSDLYVDHIDSDRQNNNIENLRYCTFRENIVYGTLKKTTSSKYVGVLFDKKRNKWKVGIGNKGVYHYLGHFDDEDVAANEYQKALLSITENKPIIKAPPKSRIGSKYKTQTR